MRDRLAAKNPEERESRCAAETVEQRSERLRKWRERDCAGTLLKLLVKNKRMANETPGEREWIRDRLVAETPEERERLH